MPTLPAPIAVGQAIKASIINAILTRLSGLPSSVQAGVVAVTPATAYAYTSVVVNFPASSFTSPPNVLVSPQTGAPSGSSGTLDLAASSISATQFTLYVKRSDTTTTSVQWAAFGS